MNKIRKALAIGMLFIFLTVSLFQNTAFSVSSKNLQGSIKNGTHATGLKPMSPEDVKNLKKSFVKANHVRPNSIGLERANKVRKSKGLKPIGADAAVPVGSEVPKALLAAAPSNLNNTSYSSTDSLTNTVIDQASLPNSVDNSTLPCFPPVANQGGIGSCVSFASTYYQLTHMVGLAYNWDAKNDPDNIHKFSPKWTNNLINGGADGSFGLQYVNAFNILSKFGCPTWAEFPYDGNKTVVKNYTEWPTSASVWRNALNYRLDQVGYVDIGEYDGDPTPVKSSDDSGLNELKQLLNNGYVLTYATKILSWDPTTIKDDPSTSYDDGYAGKEIYYRVTGSEGQHAMTVVGYDDNIWTDINGNDRVDPGEKGAFKVVNSWGPSGWGYGGFGWLAYDALNKVSSVSGWTDNSAALRQPAWDNNLAYWFTPKVSYSPRLLAEVTLNHSERNQISLTFGYSDITESEPTIKWKPSALDYNGGAYAFDGTNTACDATFTFDLTDLNPDNSLNDGVTRCWYLKANDKAEDGKPAELKSFKLVDMNDGTTYSSPFTHPMQWDGYTTKDWITCALSTADKIPVPWTIGPEMNTGRQSCAAVALSGKIYAIGGRNGIFSQLSDVEVLNTTENKWNNISPLNIARWGAGAATANGKIYVFGGCTSNPPYLNSIDEYTPETDQWVTKGQMITPRGRMGVTGLNGKLYVAGGIDGINYTVTNSFEEFNPASNVWISKPSMLTPRQNFSLAVVNNKIYAIGGIDNRYNDINTVEEYDPTTDKWVFKSDLPVSGNISNAVTVNDKIYILVQIRQNGSFEYSQILQYDPFVDKWTLKEKVPTAISGMAGSMAEVDGKLYLLGGTNENFVMIYNVGWDSTTSSSTPTYTPTSTPANTATPTSTPTTKPTNTPTPTPTSVGNISVQMFNGNRSSTNNTIYPRFKLFNKGTSPISLSDVKIRYYYTIDGEQPQNFSCDWSTVSSANVTGRFVKMTTAKTGADYYLEVGFVSGAGTLQPGASIEIQSRFWKTSYTNYTQTGDYSFNPTSTNYMDWNKTTGYYFGNLKWGIEP